MLHKDQRPYFESLDLVRGLAALVVLIYHIDFMFGLRGWLLHGGYLAVDLFFVLSGFVLSLTYGRGVANGELSVRRYMVARVARLFPLFLATTAIGFVVMTARYRSNYGDFDTANLIKSALLNVFMVPSFVTLYDLKVSFPFNPATWSIFFEMIASILFFFFFGKANRTTLAVVAAFAWLVLVATVAVFGTLDVGYASDNFIAGFPRVIFSFTVGVLIERAYAKSPWRCPALLFYVLLSAWLLLMQARSLLINPYVFDLVSVTALLPALVAAGAGVVLTGRARLLAIFLGQTSYAVYLTQGSMIIAAAGVSQILFGRKIYDFAPTVGFLFIPLVMLASYLSYRYYELPARIAMRRFGEIRTLNPVGPDSVPPQR
ncbi:acyltransferase family protein [Rhodoplanes sp. Z2-YC6860]|uniref:acyltransferase family protein n=1 Tax=Rhodoplanes sp. Z2-YC6860 TaxID=674703 RepID=UPI00078ED062|nr:acyltransferase [Rhodoplanes sp. Z2-YC6860]AMN43624.1 acyltransferase 3 [Rhodoplanes sp. Z2-YC6860]